MSSARHKPTTPRSKGTLVSKFRFHPPMKKEKPYVIYVSIMPFFTEHGIRIGQACGADKQTEGHSVNEFYSDGTVVAFDDYPTEKDAVNAAEVLAKKMGVPIAPYMWHNLHGPTLGEQRKAFEEACQKWNFIKDTQRYDSSSCHGDRANTYGHYDTQNASIVWEAACAWMRSVFQKQL